MTRLQLAKALGKDPRTLSKWLEEGLPVESRGRGGRASLFSLAAARRWLEARNTATPAPAMTDVARERARKERAQAVLAEQTFRVRQGELLPRADVEKVWGAEIAAVRAKLLALPTTLADLVHRAATLEGVPGVERALTEAMHDALRELADPNRVEVPAA